MNSIVSTAIVGTGQQNGAQPTTGTPVDTLAAQLPKENKERALLLTAGAWATYRKAGYLSQPAPTLMPPAPEETLPACSQEIAFFVDSLFRGRNVVVPEAVARLLDAKLRLPHEFLPQALSYGADHKAIRASLLPLLGERGLWLSQFNNGWKWVAQFLKDNSAELPEDAETIWQEGTYQQRSEILRRLRAIDPAKAREWLADIWKQEKAEARQQLLSTLEVQLSLDDEPFLNDVLKDRAPSVRLTAATLLARLPETALSQRMLARADAILTFHHKVLKGNKITFLKPEQLDEHWERDGLNTEFTKKPKNIPKTEEEQKAEEARQNEEFYEAVRQILSLVPPAHWSERFESSPAKLLGSLKNDKERMLALEGWTKATCLHHDTQWANVLLDWHLRIKTYDLEMLKILTLLVPEETVEHLVLQHTLNTDKDSSYSNNILELHTRSWSEQFGNDIVQKLKEHLETLKKKKSYNNYYYSSQVLEVIACHLPRPCFEQTETLKDLQEEDAKSWYLQHLNQKLDEFFTTLQTRKRIIEEIHS